MVPIRPLCLLWGGGGGEGGGGGGGEERDRVVRLRVKLRNIIFPVL